MDKIQMKVDPKMNLMMTSLHNNKKKLKEIQNLKKICMKMKKPVKKNHKKTKTNQKMNQMNQMLTILNILSKKSKKLIKKNVLLFKNQFIKSLQNYHKQQLQIKKLTVDQFK
jgi:hypothetical protein